MIGTLRSIFSHYDQSPLFILLPHHLLRIWVSLDSAGFASSYYA